MAKQWKPKRIRSEDERNTGSSGYIQLDEGQSFLGYALFEADPTVDEPGYYEFSQHWVTGAKARSVPCAGEDCPFCEDNDKPRDVANTLWLVLTDEKKNKLGEDGEGELRIFKANSLVIKQFTDMRSEDEKIKGMPMRVARLDDRGNYTLTPKTNLPVLKVGAIKEQLKSKDAPDFDQMVTSQLTKAMEGIQIARAMDDDDDPPAKKNKADKKTKKDDDEWPSDGLDEETVTVAKVDKEGNWIEVEHDDYEGKVKVWTTDGIEADLTDFSKGDEVTVTTGALDDDGEYILSDEPEAETAKKDDDEPEKKGKKGKDDPDPDENELPDKIEDLEVTIKEIDVRNQTFDVVSVEDEDVQFTLYFLDKGPASKVDFEDYEEGNVITVSADKDTVGDLVATEVPELVKKKEKAGKGGGKKKGGGKGK